MRPTVEYLQEKFVFLNNQCFGGKLKPVPIVLSNASTFLGRFCFTRRNVMGRTKCRDFLIRFSVRYDLDEAEIIDTLLHEMIHYFIVANGIKDSSTHGIVFQRKMNELNLRFGYHMTISHKVEKGSAMEQQRAEERTQRQEELKRHNIAVVEMNDGKTVVTQVASTRVRKINGILCQHYSVKSVKWYGSISPFWNRYPNSLTAKLYTISKEDLEREMQEMVSLTL